MLGTEGNAVGAHQLLEHRELARSEYQRTPVTRREPAGRVEDEVTSHEDRRIGAVRTATERAEAGDQLTEGEGLAEVVVGTQPEPGHAILDASGGGQHEHPRRRGKLEELAADLVAVHAGQVTVEDDDLVIVDACLGESGFAIVGLVDREPFATQPPCKQQVETLLVLDD